MKPKAEESAVPSSPPSSPHETRSSEVGEASRVRRESAIADDMPTSAAAPDSASGALPQLCQECGKPKGDSKHIRYGADEENPVKHAFVPRPPAPASGARRVASEVLANCAGRYTHPVPFGDAAQKMIDNAIDNAAEIIERACRSREQAVREECARKLMLVYERLDAMSTKQISGEALAILYQTIATIRKAGEGSREG